ncbi:response regulator [Desulfovibrio inopinatus]|uniref:response regulator n=1 Tax=Desulfovibrio inopinatus TaxID=102109 RepID=UPI00047F65DC|nr:response regulator [Desulfovibrio inopinatus]
MSYSILVLDDDHHVRESLAMNLEDEGFLVFQAISAEEAFKVLEKENIDLVVVDLRLPGMNGTEFIQSAKKQWQALLFIIYTGSPIFQLSSHLASTPSVSKSVFLKPLSDYESIITEIKNMIENSATSKAV